ncbi:MAG TPA: hypothetical protein VFC19_44370 [Candidatus Limnocylindrales bacterium]|nr:hypothetical protein [Candidatus Limnocylindrales bacterium]
MRRLPPTRWRREAAVRLLRLKRQWLSRRLEQELRGARETVSVRREGSWVGITATSVSAIHAHLPEALGECESLTVEVASWRSPWAGWSGKPLPGEMVGSIRVALPPKGKGRAVVRIELSRALAVEEALRIALPALDPRLPLPRAIGRGGGSRTTATVVDPLSANPCGFSWYQGKGRNHILGFTREGWVVRRAGTAVVAGVAGRPLDGRQRALLRAAGSVELGEVPARVPVEALAGVLAQLAMTGVVVFAPGLGREVPLDAELRTLVRQPFPVEGEVLAWEARSVAQRRAAMRGHAAGLEAPPPVSALLVSRRPERAVETVKALRAQTYPNLEIIVGLHGRTAPPGLEGLRVAEFAPETVFGDVLGAVSKLASGTLLTKVDDDDLYGPQHIWDLVAARLYSGATVVGKTAEFVFLDGYGMTVRRHITSEAYTDAVAGGTMLLAREDLESVGGWRPVPRSVDRALQDAVLADGGLVYSTHALGFIYVRHSAGHTWDPGVEHFLLDSRQRWEGLPPGWDS